MTIGGKGIERRGLENSLITATDLYATIAHIAGVNVSEINDSKNFASLFTSSTPHNRSYQYSDLGSGDEAEWAVSDGIYKLIQKANGEEELFKLIADPYEAQNLINGNLDDEAQVTYEGLIRELDNIRN